MDVYEAVRTRRAVRGFLDRPVPIEVLDRVLTAAAGAPSGSNLQPWHIYVVTGAPLRQLKKLATERVTAGDPWDEREFEMYPRDLKSPYRERRSQFGRERYSALGIEREDWEARQRAAIANWDCFGAPVALFCYIDRDLGRPQWADVGMYLQTVMLLLRAEGLHSCPQMAWSQVHKTVADIVSPPENLMLFCGMSIGYEDPTVEYVRHARAPIAETVTYMKATVRRPDEDLAVRFARETEPLFDVLSRAARRLTRSHADADDLLQDTLLHAYAGFHTFQEGSNLRAWLFRILYNRWVSTHRRKQSRPVEVSVDTFTEHDIVHRSAEDEVLDTLPDNDIKAAMAALPQSFKEAIYYADIQGYTYAETAKLLNVPMGTVMSRVSRGRHRLRTALAPA